MNDKALKPVDVKEVEPLSPQELLTPEEIETRLKRQDEIRRAFMQHIRAYMKEGIHFIQHQPGALPYLKQEGAMALKDFYRCRDAYEIISEHSTPEHYAICIRCTLIDPRGYSYEGLGWANSEEGNFSKRIAKQGLGTMKPVIAQMARKRALVNAVRHLPFVSEIFTEEYPEVAEQESSYEEEPPSPPPPPQQNHKTKPEGVIQARLKFIFARMKELGVTGEEQVKRHTFALLGLPEDASLKTVCTNESLWRRFVELTNRELGGE